MSAKPVFDVYNCKPIFPGEIIVARKNAMDITNTKIDDMARGVTHDLPSFSKKEKMQHYCRKLQLVWEGKLCLE